MTNSSYKDIILANKRPGEHRPASTAMGWGAKKNRRRPVIPELWHHDRFIQIPMIDNKTILALIPARAGSKGVPGKNIKPIAGKPLIDYTIESAKASRYVDRILVTSDSDRILARAEDHNVDSVRRPTQLAADDTAMVPVVRHALEIAEQSGEAYDFLLLLQPTSPMRTAEDIDCAVELLATGDCDGVISVKHLYDQHPMKVKKLVDGFLHPFCVEEEDLLRQQLAPEAFLRNGAIYLVRKEHFLEHETFKEGRMIPYVMPDRRSVNIDEPLDFAFAEYLMSGGDK